MTQDCYNGCERGWTQWELVFRVDSCSIGKKVHGVRAFVLSKSLNDLNLSYFSIQTLKATRIMNPSRRSVSMLLRYSKSTKTHSVGRVFNQIPSCLFTTSPNLQNDVQTTETSSGTSPIPLDPENIAAGGPEQKLDTQDIRSISSRRRRAAIESSPGHSFEQLPYQCFQEARLILAENRAEIVKKVDKQRERIARLVKQDPALCGGERVKRDSLRGMQRALDKLKIQADIHDPRVKMTFEDGLGRISICYNVW
jgi:hypothetical protein